MRIGFLINPIAGMGGRVGLKGTDDDVDEAVRRGATPVAPGKALETLRRLHHALMAQEPRPALTWLTCSGAMGEDALRAAGFSGLEILHDAAETPARSDTEAAARAFLDAGAELILFCGGDGTARDIARVVGERAGLLGIPSGVKMYSGVFAVSADRAADILLGYLTGTLSLAPVELLDLDEEKYRRGEWAARLTGSALTPFEPSYTQSAKALITAADDIAVKEEIAAYLAEEMEARPETLFLLGPGGTVRTVAEQLGAEKTLLGVDAMLRGAIVARDLNEDGLLALLDRHGAAELILSPIGAQGFVLGRGNLQISPAVLRRIGVDHLTIVATPAKLKRTPCLRVDTSDRTLDAALCEKGYLSVVTGYRRRRLTPIRR